jgi:hypothetical protein
MKALPQSGRAGKTIGNQLYPGFLNRRKKKEAYWK